TADVAAPDHMRTTLDQCGHEAGGLRVVHDRDVAGSDRPYDGFRVRLERPLVETPLAGTELPVVSGSSVQPGVDPLRDREERRVAVDDEPRGRDPGSARVAEQDVQELRNS